MTFHATNLNVFESGRGMPRPYKCRKTHLVGAGHARPAANQHGQNLTIGMALPALFPARPRPNLQPSWLLS